MKSSRKILYSLLMIAVTAAIAIFGVACSDADPGSAPDVTLTFMNGTSVYTTVTAKAGGEYDAPEDPKRNNYVFDGWALSEKGEVVDLPASAPQENTTYYAVFSARYTLTLDAGVGTLPDGTENKLSVKSKVNMYDVVKNIVPTVDGDAAFDAWYYGSEKLEEGSTTLTPAGNFTVSAKFLVDYKINVRKQTAYDTDEYAEPVVSTGKGFVGETISEIPAFTGFRFTSSKANEITTTPLSADKSENEFDAYYNIVGYTVIFNANLPSSTTIDGSMEDRTWGYGVEYDAPECGFSADGYRFIGWAKTAGGDVSYRVGDKITVSRGTTLYAIWAKALVEVSGGSSDYIYIAENADGTGKVAYLERYGLEEKQGSYDETTGEFVFRNASDQVLLRGKADLESGTYIYLENGESVYRLYRLGGEPDANVTLSLGVDGTATYTVKTTDESGAVSSTATEGTYAFDSESEALVFTSDEREFAFRLNVNTADDGSKINVFEIRGDEYGVWYKCEYGDVDYTKYILFDGYGFGTLYTVGYNSSLKAITTTRTVVYKTLEREDDALELGVMVIGSEKTDSIQCVLLTGKYGTDKNPVDKVFIEYTGALTMYAKPAEGETLDKATADKIVLDGYGIYKDSATYTYTVEGTDGEPVINTVKAAYALNTDLYLLEIIDIDAQKQYRFFISFDTSDAENPVIYFEQADKNIGEYFVLGLDSIGAGSGGLYTIRLLNDGVATMAFTLPSLDNNYGVIRMEPLVMAVGNYTELEKDILFEFTADISAEAVRYVYSMYYMYFLNGQGGFDISTFSRFKFTIGRDENGVPLIEATPGDGQKGVELVYDDLTFTLDGYGSAIATDAEGKMVKKSYSTDFMTGMRRVSITIEPNDPGKLIVTYYKLGEEWVRLGDNIYSGYNTVYNFALALLDGDNALLFYPNGVTVSVFSYGKVTWEDESKKLGRYTMTAAVGSSVYNDVFSVTYTDFRFGIVPVASGKDKDGNTVYTDMMFVYDCGAAVDGNTATLTAADGSTIAIDRSTGKATVTKAGEADSKEGYVTLNVDILTVTYTIPGEEGGKDTVGIIAAKLIYTGDVVTSFEFVSSEAGVWLNADDLTGTMELTGKKNAEGKYIGIYTVYDEDNTDQPFTSYEGVYESTGLDQYKFTFKIPDASAPAEGEEVQPAAEGDGEGETGGEGETEDNTVSFNFMIGLSNGNIRVFLVYTTPFSNATTYTPVYADTTFKQVVGSLTGGGYNPQVFTYNGMQMQGKFYWLSSSTGKFETESGGVAYMTSLRIDETRSAFVLLDSTFGEPNYGWFDVEDPLTATLPVNKGGDAPVSEKVTVSRIFFTGYGFANLIAAEHKDAEGNVTYDTVSCIYVQMSSNLYLMTYLDTNDEIKVVGTFGLFMFEDESGETVYYVRFADPEVKNTYFVSDSEGLNVRSRYFVGSDMSTLSMDGLTGSALYVDAKGTAHNATYRRLANADAAKNHPEVVEVKYLEGIWIVTVYFEIDVENLTFTPLANDDPRIPVDTGSEEGGEEQIAA